MAGQAPEEVVEILRRQLGAADFREALREAFQVRRDQVSGRTWTEVQELVCRCAFKGVVTTNYDPGIVDARNRVRRDAVGTGFMSWTDEDALDRWHTGDVFGDVELPVLYAHGRHTQPEAMVLATTEYRRAYAGKLPHGPRSVVSQIIAATIYFPLARTSKLVEKAGYDPKFLPLSQYRNNSFYTMRTDALDRFGTRLEKRFTKDEIRSMMENCGLADITFSDRSFWTAVGFKK